MGNMRLRLDFSWRLDFYLLEYLLGSDFISHDLLLTAGPGGKN